MILKSYIKDKKSRKSCTNHNYLIEKKQHIVNYICKIFWRISCGIKVAPKLFSKESRSRRLLETSNKTYAKPASPAPVPAAWMAHRARIPRSFRVKAIGGVVKTKVADARKEMRPIVVASTPAGNRFWTSSGIKPRGIFIHTFEIAAGKDRSLDTVVIDNRQKNWKADSLSAGTRQLGEIVRSTLPMSGFIWTESADGFK